MKSSQKKQLGICGFFRKDQLAGGVFSYFTNLLRGISIVRESDPEYSDLDVTVFHGGKVPPCPIKGFNWERVPFQKGRFVAESRVGLGRSREFDAMLFPNYFVPPVVRAKRSVVVIHDLQYKWFPEFYKFKKRAWMDVTHAFALRRASSVVSISETVREDILAKFGQRWAPRIQAIWNPVSLDRLSSEETVELPVTGPYIMSVAMDRPQKNLATLIRAFARLVERFPEHRLVLVGQLRSMRRSKGEHAGSVDEKFSSATDLVEQLGLSDRITVTGFVSDAVLGALYKNADLFVLPSLFEGFGMPAIESMVLRTPTVLSDLPVFREVTLSAATYVESPLDDACMAETIASALDAGEAARPTEAVAQELRGRCAPETVAKQYLDVLLAQPDF